MFVEIPPSDLLLTLGFTTLIFYIMLNAFWESNATSIGETFTSKVGILSWVSTIILSVVSYALGKYIITTQSEQIVATLGTRLQEDNAVKFVINTEYLPSDIESDETLLVPNKQHGSLNGTYAQNEITRLTVYDNQLNEVASYYMSAGEKRTN